MSKAISEKDMEQVVRYCINNTNEAGVLHKPVSIFTAFKDLSKDDVLFILQALNAREIIFISYADLSDSNNIHYIKPMDKACSYLIEREDARIIYWKNWRWNFGAAVITAIVSSFAGALLARISQVIWP